MKIIDKERKSGKTSCVLEADYVNHPVVESVVDKKRNMSNLECHYNVN